jgi:hypothetical protein
LKLPFAVLARDDLVPLAATGERAILVASGRLVSEEDVRRTVLHEVHGHALPRARAAESRCPVFAMGTARGTDAQEGYALVLEERAGLLGPWRARQLALRHLAALAMGDGASFVDVVSMLINVHQCAYEDAVFICERVFRGGDGVRPGLGRERVYLPAYLAVRAHLDAHPEDARVLGSGQVSVEAAPALRAYVT